MLINLGYMGGAAYNSEAARAFIMILKVNYFYDRIKNQTPPLTLPSFSYLLHNIILLQ